MISAIAPIGTDASGEPDGVAQKVDAARARGGHASSSNPLNAVRSDAVGVRERMLRATLKLIADGGVAAVTNRRVAAAAGVSLGSLTYHFASQAQLLRESLLLHVEEETARREQIAQELARQKPGVRQVAEAVEQLVAVPSEIPKQIAELELHLQAARDPELREASQRCFEAHEQIASAALSALGIPDGKRHAPAVVALMTGLAVRRLAEGGRDAQGTSDALLALVRGLEPR
ncbi:MAG TPA: TetR family transcriptional regulator [Solirubrobacteraceae bacterium]|jgi:AcrR family transcriptional regulator|nr:TetR family transcriptional regulator [Solirubrobacteraceae bacterium]